jgi:cbb3-type cytochrome oxidase subunit 3
VWFAVHPGNGKRFEEAAMLPLNDDEPLEAVLQCRSID